MIWKTLARTGRWRCRSARLWWLYRPSSPRPWPSSPHRAKTPAISSPPRLSRPGEMLRRKLEAIALPVALFLALPFAGVIASDPRIGLLTFVFAVLAAASTAASTSGSRRKIVAATSSRPMPRTSWSVWSSTACRFAGRSAPSCSAGTDAGGGAGGRGAGPALAERARGARGRLLCAAAHRPRGNVISGVNERALQKKINHRRCLPAWICRHGLARGKSVAIAFGSEAPARRKDRVDKLFIFSATLHT